MRLLVAIYFIISRGVSLDYSHVWSQVFYLFIYLYLHVFMHFIACIVYFVFVSNKIHSALWVVITHDARHGPKRKEKSSLRKTWKADCHLTWRLAWMQNMDLHIMTCGPSSWMTPVMKPIKPHVQAVPAHFSPFCRQFPWLLNDFLIYQILC